MKKEEIFFGNCPVYFIFTCSIEGIANFFELFIQSIFMHTSEQKHLPGTIVMQKLYSAGIYLLFGIVEFHGFKFAF